MNGGAASILTREAMIVLLYAEGNICNTYASDNPVWSLCEQGYLEQSYDGRFFTKRWRLTRKSKDYLFDLWEFRRANA